MPSIVSGRSDFGHEPAEPLRDYELATYGERVTHAAPTGSTLLHRLMDEVAREFPTDFAEAAFPADAAAFKHAYGDAVTRFEAARVASPRRIDIARSLTERTAQALAQEPGVASDGAASFETMTGEDAAGMRLEVPFEGKSYRDDEVLELIDRLHEQHHLTTVARDRLRWIAAYIDVRGGRLDLRGHKFAILGAAAELSPAPLLLRAGARVLWVDPTPPSAPTSGTVVYAKDASDLLGDPAAVVRSVRRFAGADRVHLGMFAYAPGKGRELRLAEAMNAIATALGKDALRSVAMFVSPTSPGELQPEDSDVVERRRAAPKMWQRALAMAGVLHGPGHYRSGTHAAARAVISLQGANYQAAQYVSKMLRAEVFAQDGVRVSANVAGISRTRSLQHPLFQAAFEGAPAFGVRIFDANTTRALATLLMLHDLLVPESVGTDLASIQGMHSAQIHGGVYTLPWQFEAAVRAAAVLGAARRPTVLFKAKRSATRS